MKQKTAGRNTDRTIQHRRNTDRKTAGRNADRTIQHRRNAHSRRGNSITKMAGVNWQK